MRRGRCPGHAAAGGARPNPAGPRWCDRASAEPLLRDALECEGVMSPPHHWEGISHCPSPRNPSLYVVGRRGIATAGRHRPPLRHRSTQGATSAAHCGALSPNAPTKIEVERLSRRGGPMHCAYCALGVLRASLRIRDRTSVKQTSRAGPVPSLVGAALGRLASSRRCAVSLIRGLRGSAIGRILEAQTAKSSRGACRTLLATRINALPAACVYRAPWIFDGVSSAGPSQGGRRRQSGGYQFSHAVSLPTPATIKSAIHHWRGYWLSHIEICTHRSRMDREKIPCKI